MAFERWTERIVAADDERGRRQLLGEIGQWRAAHLADIPALRDAAYAMSRLYALLNDHDSATREARSLLSLCQTPPLATPEELADARAYLHSLGSTAVVVTASRPERPKRGPSRPKERPAGRDRAATLAAQGKWREALAELKGNHGPTAELTRTWIVLARALADDDPAAIRDLEGRLRHRLVGEAPRQAPAPAPQPQAPVDDHPLSALVGGPVPRKWKSRLAAIERVLQAQPERADEVAALALDHHVTTFGPKAPAPWLIGVVGRALATSEGARTREAIARFAGEGAYAVTAYGEAPFAVLVGLLRAGIARGWTDISLRRGVSSRGEPRERKLWTLRATHDGVEGMVVVGSEQAEPYAEGSAERLAERIPALCPRAALYAPGPGNAGLRDAAAAHGIAVAGDPTPEALLAALDSAEPVEPPPAEDPDAALRAIAALVCAPDMPSEDALTAALAGLDRVHPAFGVVRDALAGAPDAEARAAAFLRAAHRAAPGRARLPEGITLAVRLAAEPSTSGAAREVLVGEPTAARYGGPGIETVIELVGGLAGDGWRLDRVLHGPTARERRTDPVLGALSEVDGGLWRIRVMRDDKAADVWLLTALPPEARAAVPRLISVRKPSVVVLGDDPGLPEWFASLGEGEAVPAAEGAAAVALRLQA